MKAIIYRQVANWQRRHWARRQREYDLELTFQAAVERFNGRQLHAYMHHHFHQRAPKFLREHRAHFAQSAEVFGEDAFHAMWWLLLLQEQPVRLLEIGVHRGQILSLWALIAKHLHLTMEVHGISPFSDVGDSVSNYESLDYEAEVRANFQFFGLPDPILVRARSEEFKAKEHIEAIKWDLIYIDGSHDYGVVRSDYLVSSENLRIGGLLIMDDVISDYLSAPSFRAPLFSFAGHAGPSRVAAELARDEMVFVAAVGHNAIFRKR